MSSLFLFQGFSLFGYIYIGYSYQMYHGICRIDKRAKDCNFELVLKSRERDILLIKISKAISIRASLSRSYESDEKVWRDRDSGRCVAVRSATTAEHKTELVALLAEYLTVTQKTIHGTLHATNKRKVYPAARETIFRSICTLMMAPAR